jgi:hypothetical protein
MSENIFRSDEAEASPSPAPEQSSGSLLEGCLICLRNSGFDEPNGPRHLLVYAMTPDGREVPLIREYYGDGPISHAIHPAGIVAAFAALSPEPTPTSQAQSTGA